ncbi:oxidoreductase [Nitratidesulfovibrio vulgaris]|uniref:oxidoreductase n=1 Tax=Nitratidesulfovibrio vulgaris TaxID=881 RepID=UPI002301DD40|nr:hypothetical protein [Nitratidesulfovibrio vulgaris]WCB46970.1 hypothetical protein PH214_02510 [Nitratidesulfovibrio vulgaris]
MNSKINFELAPINTGFTKDGIYDHRIIDFHRLRSGNNINVSCIGNIATSQRTTTNKTTAYVNDRNKNKLEELAKIITNNGSIASAQLASRISAIPPKHTWENEITEHVTNASHEICAASEDIIQQELSEITEKAITIAHLGFQIIQIHAAHGYFLSRLLNRVVNKRKDKFSFGNLSWLKDIRSNFSQRAPHSNLEIRINIADGIESYEEELTYKKDIIKTIQNCGISRISLSNGFYDINKSHIYPNDTFLPKRSLNNAIHIANDNPSSFFSIAGNILECITPDSSIPNNLSIAVGRPLIADPRAIINFYSGKSSSCIKCGECHYFSNRKEFLSCSRPTSQLSPN